MSSIKGIAVRRSECLEMLEALLAGDADALAEADKLFLGEKPRYAPGGILNYFFCIPPSAADGADGEALAFRPRNDHERLAVLLAPEDHGLVPLFSEIEITPEMMEAGVEVLREYDPRVCSLDGTAEGVFLTMLEVGRQALKADYRGA